MKKILIFTFLIVSLMNGADKYCLDGSYLSMAKSQSCIATANASGKAWSTIWFMDKGTRADSNTAYDYCYKETMESEWKGSKFERTAMNGCLGGFGYQLK